MNRKTRSRLCTLTVAIFFMSVAGEAMAQRPDQVRLTSIESTAGGSNCSLYLDRSLRVLVGEWEFGDPFWIVGLNGQTYRLRASRGSRGTERIATVDGSVVIEIVQGPVVRNMTVPGYPRQVRGVAVRVRMTGQSATIPAYQFCGEG